MHVCRILVDKENVNTEKVNKTRVQLKEKRKNLQLGKSILPRIGVNDSLLPRIKLKPNPVLKM